MKKHFLPLLPLFLILALDAGARDFGTSIVRVIVTSQTYDFIRPWQKKPPIKRGGTGVVVGVDKILVPGNLLANATFIELEQIGGGQERCEASVQTVDYVANLGLLTPKDEEFSKRLKPVKILEKPVKKKDSVFAVQYEENGMATESRGQIKNIDTSTYPGGRGHFLVYNVSIELALGNTGTIPFFRKNRLLGMMIGFREANRTASLIPAPVIRHFLEDSEDGTYSGFPRSGFSFAKLSEPQLRRYVGLKEGDPGVYVASVRPGGPCDVGGLQKGDVLLGVDGFEVTRFGQYKDPDYGLLSISNYISLHHQTGEEVVFRVLRDGEQKEFPITLGTLAADEYPIPPYVFGRAPRFIVVGGFVFQEVSQPLLSIWGDWETKAPRHLSRLARRQWELFKPGERAVILTRVLATPENIGYENLNFQLIKSVNGKEIKNVADIAAALNTPEGEYHIVRLDTEGEFEIPIKSATLDRANNFIRMRYGLPKLSQLD